MPYTKKSNPTRKYPRKTFRKRKYYKKSFTKSVGFPKSLIAKLKYSETFSLNPPASGTVVGQTFRLNSLYDPNAGIGGHQPTPFDQYCMVYNRYHVIGAKITVTPIPTNNNTGGQIVQQFVLTFSNAANEWSGLSMDDILQNKNTSKPAIHGGFYLATDSQMRSITRKWSAKKWFGPVYMDKDHSASPTANPLREAFCHVCATAADLSGDPVNMYYRADIEYVAIFDEHIMLASS